MNAQTTAKRSNATRKTANRSTVTTSQATRSTANQKAPKPQSGLRPFQPRPEVPQQIINFALNLQDLGFSIQQIVDCVNNRKEASKYMKIPNIKNIPALNYNDLYKHIGHATPRSKQKAA